MNLRDYYHIANFPTERVPAITHPLPALALVLDEQPTQHPRAVVRMAAPDPLVHLARRDRFAARVFLARLLDAQRRAVLFGDVTTQPDMWEVSAASALTLTEQAALHAALSDPARLHLLALADGTRTYQELEEALAVRYQRLAQPTVTHHLRILHHAGLLTCGKHGLFRYYRTCHARLDALAETLKERAR